MSWNIRGDIMSNGTRSPIESVEIREVTLSEVTRIDFLERQLACMIERLHRCEEDIKSLRYYREGRKT